jgi:hypothetical protein
MTDHDEATLETGAERASDHVMHRKRIPQLLRRQPQGFDSAEHRRLGDQVNIWSLESLSDVYDADWYNHLLQLAPDLKLTYGQIVALAGDLYGIPSRPISNGKDANDRRKRFEDAFNSLVNCIPKELKSILAIMDEESAWLDQQMRAGVAADIAYATGPKFDDKYMAATGGTNVATNPGRYLDLAKSNFDHFGSDAVTAYSTGHAVAIDMALEAGRYMKQHGSSPQGRLEANVRFQKSLAASAFADHYLTDLFSSGHLRVPRRPLAQDFDTWSGLKAAGSLMAKFQHDEDSRFGLFVRNSIGRCWKCFGDGHLLTLPGDRNASMAWEAIQESMAEVWVAFRDVTAPKAYKPLTLIPDLTAIGRHESAGRHSDPLNFAAAFIERDGHPLGREPFEDVDSHQWAMISQSSPPRPGWAGGKRPDTVTSLGALLDAYAKSKGYEGTQTKPPADTIKPPTEAPKVIRHDRANRTASPVKGPVRWAVAFIGRRNYPNNEGSTEFISDPGPWSDWEATRPQQIPVISVQTDPSGKAVGRHIMRQVEGQPPQFFAGSLADNFVQEWGDIAV